MPDVRGLTRETGIALLDRAAEVGLLTAYGGGYYAIHPALPWYFKSLFEQYYATDEQHVHATRAFVEATGELGTYYHNQYEDGNRSVIDVLSAEEANLLHARLLARRNGWWRRAVNAMQGLNQLYDHMGRRVEWRRLVDEIVPDFVDRASDGPLPGREEQWNFVTQYRVGLVLESRDWAEAERLQRMIVDLTRQRVAAVLALPQKLWDGTQRNEAHTLAVSIEQLGHIQRELDQEECVATYQEALNLFEQIGKLSGAANCAFNIGHAYKDLPTIRDLEQAEQWYNRSLELSDERDNQRRAQSLGQLGFVAYQRFKEAQSANQTQAELLRHLNAALQLYIQALELLPVNAIDSLAVTHNQLGNIFYDSGDLERALAHWHESIRYKEAANNIYGAGTTRRNIAVALAQHGRFDHALLYAQAALRNFETYGANAAADIEETQLLIAAIEAAMRGEGAEGAASD